MSKGRAGLIVAVLLHRLASKAMRSQPSRNYKSDDVVQTPPEMAARLVAHFSPWGRILEPCRGDGNFFRALPEGTLWCEIREGRDFFAWDQKVDWIVTNPPWSQIRAFLNDAMRVADEVVFLVTVNHLWTKARLRDVREAGFGIRQIVLVEMPASFPQSGFQLGAIHLSRGWSGDIRLVDLSVPLAQGEGRGAESGDLKAEA